MLHQSATLEVALAAPAAPPLPFSPLQLLSGMWSEEDQAKHALFTLLSHVPCNAAFVALY